ncbi:E3 ubiquitin-protein ligase TRIM47-like [Pholidichthys leucotaenia]
MSELHLECCICLDQITCPASLPCGHSFCLVCIGDYWRIHGPCQCPLCKKVFPTRPQLQTDHTRQSEDAAAPLKAGEVPCDLCLVKGPAIKSCLVCLESYCATHLEPHYQKEDLGRHLLISVVKNLDDSVCKMHGRKLERFCRSDRTCICAMCAQTEHKCHSIVSIGQEVAKRKRQLKGKSVKLQQGIQEKQNKAEKLKRSADIHEEHSSIKEFQQLEDEVSEMQKKRRELEQLLQTEDNLAFLRVCIMMN